MVSIVTPAYNAGSVLAESIRSVAAQTYADWELIIVDDCSTDGSPAVAARFAETEPRIRYHRNPRNSGAAFSRNQGVALARGEWIAFLDADDLMTSDKLAKQMIFVQENNAQISYTASAFMDADGKRFEYILPAVKKLTYNELLKRNLMSCSSVMAKRELLVKHPFPSRANTHEDYAAWLAIVREVDCAYGLNEPLLIYRLSANSKSANRLTSARMSYNAYREVGYSPIISAALMCRYAVWSVRKRKRIYASFMVP
ncbi:MAG: glycosyltransferase family 2 protein [Peptococcaceae bacterium]|jgi:teichuronic acid biosynthesis glycosyltransferase TuaG|nr:glycosyltransferase family 2 protein [Peptococcaceae bacterium]